MSNLVKTIAKHGRHFVLNQHMDNFKFNFLLQGKFQIIDNFF